VSFNTLYFSSQITPLFSHFCSSSDDRKCYLILACGNFVDSSHFCHNVTQNVTLIVPSGENLVKVEDEWTLITHDAILGGKLRDAFDGNRKADLENQQVLDRLIFESDTEDDDKKPDIIIIVVTIIAAGAIAGVVAAGTTGTGSYCATAATATAANGSTDSAAAMGPICSCIAKLPSLWEAYGTLWKQILTSIYLLYKTSQYLGGNTCFVVINDSPKQLDLIVKGNKLTVTEQQGIGVAFDPPEISGLSCCSFSQTYTKDVSRVINTIQKIPLPKEKSRKILVQGKDCYLTLRSYDPKRKGYIVHLVDYHLPRQRKTKLDDLAQGIFAFHPDPGFKESEPAALDETFDDDGSHQEAENNAKAPTAVSALDASAEVRTEERISSGEFYSDPRTDLESPPKSSRPLAPVAFSACQTAIEESNMVQTRVDQFFGKEAKAPTTFQEASLDIESNMVQTRVDQFFKKEARAPTAFQEAKLGS
jgi:hypothetical protein